MELNFKLFFGAIAILLTFAAFVPYIRSIVSGDTRPHVFSWIIWGITTIIVFFAQLNAKGGIGAWSIGVSGVITIFIAVLAFLKRSDSSINYTDWFFFSMALASLPLWYLTASPMWAVVVLTIVDLLGFGPTIRKAYDSPYQENIPFFLIFIARNTFALFALEYYSVTTVLFPLSVTVACILLIILISYRRKIMSA